MILILLESIMEEVRKEALIYRTLALGTGNIEMASKDAFDR